ncbi:MAG: agmatinase [Spirochaetales bacterium]|nr:agmatinase [Spirochaetales bacterium]
MNSYPSFLSLPHEHTAYETSAYVLVPVPYDGTSTYGKGADKGPEALLEASDQLENYDVEMCQEACFDGIHLDRKPFSFKQGADGAEDMVHEVKTRTSAILSDGKTPVIIGGEHSVSIGAIRAAAAAHPNLTVLQVDAHSDMRNSYHGSSYNHACVMARAKECAEVLQVGIRSTAREELAQINDRRIWWDHQIHGSGQWIEEVVSHIRGPVYITFDLDGFDPALLPSTGTPQPGGLNWHEATALLRRTFSTGQVLGWDITELCPDGTRTSPFIAAKLLYKMINYHKYYKREGI